MTEHIYGSGAQGYDAMFARVTAAFMPALLDAARIAPGHRVLDIATGTGAAARAARAAAGPLGTVRASDISPTMLAVARANPENADLIFDEADAHQLPYPDAAFDRVICQLGLAFFDDPTLALREVRRVLAPAGRVAVTVNSTPDRSLFTRIGTVIGRHVPAKAEALNRYASIRDLGRLHALLDGAGFADVETRPERQAFPFASFDDYFAPTEAGAASSGQVYVTLPPALRRQVREEVRRDFGPAAERTPFVVGMEVLVGAGNK